jgi:hypothetical protein
MAREILSKRNFLDFESPVLNKPMQKKINEKLN